MMYYGLILLTTVMFGIQFALNDKYRRMRGGSGLIVSMQSSLIGAASGLLILNITNGFKWEFTPFTFLIAALSALSGLCCSFVGFKALDKVNLSLYSLFMMLGGMAIPSLSGILFFREGMTPAKGVCFLFVTISMVVSVGWKGNRESKSGLLCCILIFFLNGTAGILSKVFNEASFARTSAAGYAKLSSFSTILFSAVLLLVLSRKKTEDKTVARLGWGSVTCVALGGGINAIANFILVFALTHVDASVQYPMVSGGVIIVSTLLSYLSDKRPGKREWLAVVLAFIGVLALFIA